MDVDVDVDVDVGMVVVMEMRDEEFSRWRPCVHAPLEFDMFLAGTSSVESGSHPSSLDTWTKRLVRL